MIAGRGPAPSLVLSLVMRLPDTSMTAALANGGTDHFGWGVDRHLAADLYDAINVNTKVSGNWKTKPPDIPEWPRPHTTSAETAAPAPISVADIYKRFTRR